MCDLEISVITFLSSAEYSVLPTIEWRVTATCLIITFATASWSMCIKRLSDVCLPINFLAKTQKVVQLRPDVGGLNDSD